MQTRPTSRPAAVVAAAPMLLATSAAPCVVLTAAKASAKVLKKWHKHENRRLFFSWCACLHALGFSF